MPDAIAQAVLAADRLHWGTQAAGSPFNAHVVGDNEDKLKTALASVGYETTSWAHPHVRPAITDTAPQLCSNEGCPVVDFYPDGVPTLPQHVNSTSIVVCLDVAQYILSAQLSSFVRLLVGKAPRTVMFSSASPGEGDTRGLPMPYPSELTVTEWQHVFLQHGYVVDVMSTIRARNSLVTAFTASGSLALIWYAKNTLVFHQQPSEALQAGYMRELRQFHENEGSDAIQWLYVQNGTTSTEPSRLSAMLVRDGEAYRDLISFALLHYVHVPHRDPADSPQPDNKLAAIASEHNSAQLLQLYGTQQHDELRTQLLEQLQLLPVGAPLRCSFALPVTPFTSGVCAPSCGCRLSNMTPLQHWGIGT